MSMFLVLAFLFFIGSTLGWILELFYRRFISAANPDRKWINPGFCTGPYLPIYGCGLCALFLLALLEKVELVKNPILEKVILFTSMAIAMTLIEYLAGLCMLKFSKVRLWDYRKEWGNIQGIICPKFSFYWAVLGALYYFFINPHIINALIWLSNNLAFSFVIGLFFGFFIIDVVNAAQLVAKLKKYAEENDVIVRYESIKAHIRQVYDEKQIKYHFFRPFHTELPLIEHLHEMKEMFETKIHKRK